MLLERVNALEQAAVLSKELPREPGLRGECRGDEDHNRRRPETAAGPGGGDQGGDPAEDGVARQRPRPDRVRLRAPEAPAIRCFTAAKYTSDREAEPGQEHKRRNSADPRRRGGHEQSGNRQLGRGHRDRTDPSRAFRSSELRKRRPDAGAVGQLGYRRDGEDERQSAAGYEQ
jgi:hypothetical protein